MPRMQPFEGHHILPLRSPTLPPATTTNAVFIDDGGLWILDPAPVDAAGRSELSRHLEPLARDGRLAGIVLTHHHRDHVGAASWLSSHFGLPVAAHSRTAELAVALGLPGLHITRHLGEGDTLGGAWEALETPGHASDHLVFIERHTGLAVVGDMVATVGTIVVDPPDGHMGTYLASLSRLERLGLRRVVPAHGPPIEAPSDHFRGYLQHRAMREAKIVDALGASPVTVAELARRSWPELDPRILPLAARACLAHLEHLLERGVARHIPELDMEGPAHAVRPWLFPNGRWVLA